MAPHITLSEADDPPEAKAALEGLSVFNAPWVGPNGCKPMSLVVRRAPAAEPVGGAFGWCYGGWYFLQYLYLPEDLRGTGLGAQLMARLEAEAKLRGCVGAWLDTFDFQAPSFYEKQGYTRFGTLDDYPPGHARHFYRKRFEEAA